MRGPLLSGALGSRATIACLARLLDGRGPVAVLSTIWLGELLSQRSPVFLLVEPQKQRAARRAAQRAARAGRPLLIAGAGEELPLRPGGLPALVVDHLAEIESETSRQEADAFVRALVACLRPGGLLVALDRTRDRAVEAALSRRFLAAALSDVGQERPRDGVVLTVGAAPPAIVARALAEARAAHG